MKQFNTLLGCLANATKDSRLLPIHISLYLAIMSTWEQSGFRVPFHTNRKNLMRLSKLASTATYHKCIRDLVQYEYVSYKPSYNHYKGSEFFLILK